jgi:ABC-type transport system involved in multi-copper enzyme maturation permease subunit
MILLVARKDFLTNLLSARFVIGFLLCLVLIPFSILINVSRFREQTAQYRIDHDAAEKAVHEVRVYSKLRPEIVLPPEPLSVFGKGLSDQVGNRIKIRLGDKPMMAAGKTAAGDNPFLASFLSVDFVDIAAIIFSLLALIFSYDAFTREKEDGTLKLEMSNSLSRSACLAGKVLGILFTLLPVLVFSFLLGSVLVLLSRHVSFSAVEWGRIALLFAASLLYLAVFVFAGLLVSARSKSSVTSLVVCLFLWVLFVFLVPTLSANFAESFARVESRDNLDRVLADLDRQRSEDISQGFKARGLPQGFSCWWCSNGDDGYMETYGNSDSEFEVFRDKAVVSEPIRLEYADKRWASQKAYLDSLNRQARLARGLSFVSPTGLFRAIASAVCATDSESHQDRMDRTRRYREIFINYFKAKDIFSSFSWVTPVAPDTFMTEDELIERRTGGEFTNARDFDAWASEQKDPMVRWRKLGAVALPGDSPEDFPFLDVSDMPRFEDPPKTLLAGLENSIPRAGALLVETVLLFYLGFVAFIRFDVR